MINRDSPLRIEINPWTLNSHLNETMQLRGAYIAALGTIETILTEVAIRASRHPHYEDLRAKFPSRRPDRLKYIRSLCERPGPLEPFASLIHQIVNRFEDGLDLRDVLAHGRMRVLSGPGDDASITVEDYAAEGAEIRFRTDKYYLITFRHKVHAATRFSRIVDRLYGELGNRLPPLRQE